MLRIYARRNFSLLRGAAIQLAPHQQALLLRHYSDETDSLESQKATLSATNEALRSMLNSMSSGDKAAAAADTSSVMKSTTEKLEAISAAASAATAFDSLRNTRNTLRDSNENLRNINSRLDRQQSSSPVVERKEAELRQIRTENDGLRKVLNGEVVADSAPKTRSRSSSSAETTTTTYQSVWTQPPPPPPQQRTVHTTDYVIVNNSTASSPPPPPRRPREYTTGTEWPGEDTESFWFKYRVPLAAAGGFATGLFVGNLVFSHGKEKQSKAEKARVAQLQREIDAEKREQERLLKEIARKTNT